MHCAQCTAVEASMEWIVHNRFAQCWWLFSNCLASFFSVRCCNSKHFKRTIVSALDIHILYCLSCVRWCTFIEIQLVLIPFLVLNTFRFGSSIFNDRFVLCWNECTFWGCLFRFVSFMSNNIHICCTKHTHKKTIFFYRKSNTSRDTIKKYGFSFSTSWKCKWKQI